jgi:tetratricopeptide (TPR) repeat protein
MLAVLLLVAAGATACATTSPDQEQREALQDEVTKLIVDASLCKVNSDLAEPQARIAACSRLIERGEPKDALLAGYNNRALLYRRMGKDAEALNDFEEAIRLFPRSTALYVNRGKMYSDDGKLDLAEQDFRSALALTPENTVVLNNLAWVLLQRGDYSAGLVLVNRALASAAEPQIVYDTQAHALMGLGQVEAAAEAFRRAAEIGGADLVRRYQTSLASKGYDPGSNDGVMDGLTRAALSSCIRDNCRLLLD